jgi:hypothetical protein
MIYQLSSVLLFLGPSERPLVRRLEIHHTHDFQMYSRFFRQCILSMVSRIGTRPQCFFVMAA